MADIATLQFKADTGDIKSANAELDKLAVNARKVESASDGAAAAIKKMGQSGSGGVKQTAADVDALLDKLNPTSKAFDELDRSMRQLSQARSQKLIDTEQFNDFNSIIERQRIALQRTYDDLTGYSERVRAAEAAERQATISRQADIASLGRLQAVLDPAGEAVRRLQDQFTLLSRTKASGLIDTQTYDNLTGRLRTLTAAAKESQMSAGQMANGWNNATNQFIDFGVQLQAGQSPITALVQQGPQLAMAFGNVGNTLEAFKQQFIEVGKNFGIGAASIDDAAAEAADGVGNIAESMNNTVEAGKRLSTGFASFITPMTVGLAAVAAGATYLAYQLYQSYKQTDLLNQAMAKTGYQAGVSAKSLKEMAAALAETTGSSEENAIKAVATAAAIGKSATELRGYANTALNVSRETGESVDELVSKFAQLSDDPVKALQVLGNQFGFLTPTIYEQVKALVAAGDKAGAYGVVLAQVNERMDLFKNDQKNSLGEVEGFWDGLIDKVGEYLTKSQEIPKIPTPVVVTTGFGPLDMANKAAEEAQKKAADTAKANFNLVAQAAKDTGAFVDSVSKKTKEAAEAAIAVDSRSVQYQQRSAKIAEDIKQTQKDILSLQTGGTKEQLKRADALLAAQKKQYDEALKAEAKKDAPAKQKAVKADAGDSLTEQYAAQNLALEAQIKLLQNRSAYEANASTQRKSYLELEAKYTILEQAATSRKLTTQEQQMLSVKDEALAQAKILADKGDQLATLQRQAQVGDEISKLQAVSTSNAQVYAEYQGQSTKELQRQLELAQAKAAVLAKGGTQEQADIAAQIKQIDFDQADARAADWVNGMKTGLADWADTATNYAKIAGDAVQKGMGIATDAVSNFALTGKADFADFTKSILKMILDIISQLLVMQSLKAGANAIGFGGLFANAKGGVYDDPSLSKFSNGVFNSPQTFQFGGRSQFAKGGVFAEAGPEAIMPLTRDSNGRLGVKAEGGSGGGISIDQQIVVNSNGMATTNTTSSGEAVGRALGDQMSAAATEVVRKALQPGGIIYRANRGQ